MAEPEPLVADVAIVGAGLAGLALARLLVARGLSVSVLEARPRLGGRVLTQPCAQTGQPLDLGPTWFWPATEPRIAALLAELGLTSFAQHDPGDALWLTDPNRAPERRESGAGGVHAGAQRIVGGAARLTEVLAAALPPGSVQLRQAVQRVQDLGDMLLLHTEAGRRLRARRVVLALPPRLVHERIAFDPPLPAALDQALAAVPTWMAAQAKALLGSARPFWRAAGHSGNAFVRHAQAVLGEVYDAGGPDDGTAAPAALGGLFALDAAQRQHFRRGLAMLVDSQFAQLYGAEAHQGQVLCMDWAEEPWTCAQADRQGPAAPPEADAALRQPHWAGRLLFAGTETATHGAGHMEGALESAERAARRLLAAAVSAAPVPAAAEGQAQAVAAFADAVAQARAQAPAWYRAHLTRLLSSQHGGALTQRALLASADQLYSQALAQLDTLLPQLRPGPGVAADGRHVLTAALLAPFAGWNKALVEAALGFNASSCALSNFPDEHRPDAAVQRAITLDLAAAWHEFALELNERLLGQPARLAEAA